MYSEIRIDGWFLDVPEILGQEVIAKYVWKVHIVYKFLCDRRGLTFSPLDSSPDTSFLSFNSLANIQC